MENNLMENVNMNVELGTVLDPGQLVPPEEQMAELESLSNQAIVTVEVVRVGASLENLIPDEEQSVEEIEPSKFVEAAEQGYFSPAMGMACLKTNSELNECIYGAVNIDANGIRTVEFCQKYSDGTFSPRMEVKQSDLLFAAANRFTPSAIPIASQRNKIAKFIGRVFDDYLGKQSGKERFNILDILTVLVEALPNLPAYTDVNYQQTPEEFYTQLIDAVNGDYSADGSAVPAIMCLRDFKAYYAFSTDNIIELARRMGMKKGTLINRLNRHNFLYLTPSSQGSQTKIKLGMDTVITGKELSGWAYCVYKMDYIGQQLIKK